MLSGAKQRKARAMMFGAMRWSRRRWTAAAALAVSALSLLAASVRVLAPPSLEYAVHFPHMHPADLAQLLADISANTHPIPGSWSLEEEAGNYSSWRYAVSYTCGARCGGRVAVEAHETHARGAPRHGRADAHRVLVRRTECTTLPLLPWPRLCAEVEMQWAVSAERAGSGARVAGRAEARCGAAAALLAACPSAAALRVLADQHLLRLQQATHARIPHH